MTIILNQKEESVVSNSIDNDGILVYTIEPSRESKGSWSEIFLLNGVLYNRVYSDTQDAWMVLIEKLENNDELEQYMTEDKKNKILIKYNLK